MSSLEGVEYNSVKVATININEANDNSLIPDQNNPSDGLYIVPSKFVPNRPEDITGYILSASNMFGKLEWADPELILDMSAKDSVRAATTENININIPVGTIDDVSLNVSDRVLVKNQNDPTQNGIYEVNSNGILERTKDTALGTNSTGTYTIAVEGTENARTLWISTEYDSVYGDPITFSALESLINSSGKESVRVASTEDINLTLPVATVDGVALNENDRVLVKNQTDTTETGIYKVNASSFLERTNDAALGTNSTGTYTIATEGDDNAKTLWISTEYDSVFGDPITFSPLESLTSISAKESVRVASTGDIDLLLAVGSIDGVALNEDDRVLVKDQVDTTENGFYKVNATSFLERTTDAALGTVSTGTFAVVTEGTANERTLWLSQTYNSVFGDAITFVTLVGGGGGGSPGGVNTNIQFNDGGTFGGTSDLTWDGTTFTVGTGALTNFNNITDSTAFTNGSIVAAGGVGIAKNVFCGGNITAVDFISTSDRRRKENITPLNHGIETIEKINPVSYNMINNPGKLNYGVIAQELQEIGLENLVHEDQDEMLSVNYLGFIGILIQSQKELVHKVNQLTEQINELQQK